MQTYAAKRCQILEGSLSAVSKPIFAVLHDLMDIYNEREIEEAHIHAHKKSKVK